MSAEPDPRRACPIETRIGRSRRRRAYLFIDGQMWAIIEGAGKRWCVEDSQSLCLEHIENACDDLKTMDQAIALAEAMIRDGRMPTPEEAKRLWDERKAEEESKREAWTHPERLYEPLADTLELWAGTDLARSNSYCQLRDQLIALVTGAVGHFENERGYALMRLVSLDDNRDPWSGRRIDKSFADELAQRQRERLAYADEHLARAQQILETHMIANERQQR